jgi:hypothetical protein
MPVKPPAPRHTISDLGDHLAVHIPSLKYWPVLLVSSMWFVMWLAMAIGSVVGVFTTKITGPSDVLFAVIWLGIVFGIGMPIVYGFCWQIIGYEEILVSRQAIKIGQVALGLRTQKEYSADYIKDLRSSSADSDFMGRTFVFPFTKNRSGAVAFDYGAKTFKFGSGVEEAEGKQIIAEIQNKFPQYKS